MKKYGITLLFSWQVIFSIAQSSSIQFLPINTELSQNTVTDILQDHNGFLWIGTRNGLNKYDGSTMVSYELNEQDSTSLRSGYIKVIYEDSNQTLWVGTKGGLCRYMEDTDSFDRFISKEIADNLSKKSILSIHEDKNQVLWIGTDLGLVSYNQLTHKVNYYMNKSEDKYSISGNEIISITEDNASNLWIATFKNGLNRFDQKTKKFINYKPKDSLSLVSPVINELHTGKTGRVWLATQNGVDWLGQDENGLYVFNNQKIDKEKHNIIGVLEDSKGYLWVGVENEGLYKINLKTNESIQYKYDPEVEFSLKSSSVWSLYEDNRGVIWVGTYNKGIFKVDENAKKFTHFKHSPNSENSLSNSTVTSFAEDEHHNLWIGTDGGGLNYWNIKKNTFTNFNAESNPQPFASNAVLSLLMDTNENLWIGTWGDGVFVKQKGSTNFEKFKIAHSSNEALRTENIYSIIEDDNGYIWFATFGGGLYLHNPMAKLLLEFRRDNSVAGSINSDYVTSLLEDSKGQLWVGTNSGLNKVVISNEEIRFKSYLQKKDAQDSKSSLAINSILEDSQGRLWLGTSAGLELFDSVSETFKKFGKKEGLPNEVIYAIQEDLEGNLWLSSNKGLSRFNKKTQLIENFTKADGLQAMEFFRGASLKLNSGELLFGGVEGFNKFLPEKIIKSTEAPVVYLTDFKVNNKSVKLDSGTPLQKVIRKTAIINLTYQQNDFGFEFGIISFRQTPKNKFAYQLVGYDKTWQEIGNKREAFFTNIPPGSYTFKIKATNNDGIWSNHQVIVKVVINPPWYATNWAYIGYIILLIVLLAWGYQTVINRERLKTALQMEHLELVKMQELDEMKSNFFTNITHEFRTPLTLMLGPLKSIFKNSNQPQVAMMIRNGERLLQLIDRILDLSKLEAGKMELEATNTNLTTFLHPIISAFLPLAKQKNITYKIEMPKEETPLYVDREKIEKVVVNLLSNAFKYTPPSGKITFKLENQETKIVLVVKDNGIGIPPSELGHVFNRYYRIKGENYIKQEGTGIGLSLTKELVELHKGSIEVQSVEGKGVVFKVYLKKGKQHLSPDDIKNNTGSYLFTTPNMVEIKEKHKRQLVTGKIKEDESREDLPILLIIDDNEDIRDYIRDILEPTCKVLESGNGIDGLAIAKEQIPDLIISDIMIPGVDGLLVCKKLKADIKTSHIPLILLTAKATNENTLQGFKHGADYYITKPFDPQLLVLRVRNALNTRDYIRENIQNKKTLEIESEKVNISSRDQAFINHAVSIVEKYMFDPEFTVENLADHLNLSRTQLYRKMKGLLGQSANEFIKSLKLKKAVILLDQSQMTIAEITYEVGFSDLKYFRNCFKKQFGMSPSMYKCKKK